MVDVGSDKRQIVSGIAGFYAPEDLVGRDVVVIANLAPAVLFGVESRGMILAAGEEASLFSCRSDRSNREQGSGRRERAWGDSNPRRPG